MTVYRSRIFSPLADPFGIEDSSSTFLDEPNGFIAVEHGKIAAVGSWKDCPDAFRGGTIIDLGSDHLITPGFFDTHLHAPQLEMIGSYGGHLLEWLNRYTFPTEARFSDVRHARKVASALFDELLRNGTLTSLIFSTIHLEATEAFFEEAEARGCRAIIGKTMMDRCAPDTLIEDPETSYLESRTLLQKWDGRSGLRYAITPRFAPTSTPHLLELAGDLKREFPNVYMHTHVSENRAEIDWVRELFPEARNYVDVYDRAGLLDEYSVLAHGVHLSDEELSVLAERGSRIAHCPNSNLFLGSGLFPLKRTLAAGVKVGLGSDIGAGTTPSMFNAMSDAYKVQQVSGVSLSPFELWYMASLGGAEVLSMQDVTGSLAPGKDADFLVLDLHSTPLLSMRTSKAATTEDLLAGLIFMGDDRLVSRAICRGRELYRRP